jgi:hypothetical protein
VLAPGLLAPPVRLPDLDTDPELLGNQLNQGRGRQLLDAENDAGEAQVAKLNGKARAVLAEPRRCRMIDRSVSLSV